MKTDRQEELEKDLIDLLYDIKDLTWTLQARSILLWLKRKGAVLKVEKELPTRMLHLTRTLQECYYLGKQDMLKAGFTATEDLI